MERDAAGHPIDVEAYEREVIGVLQADIDAVKDRLRPNDLIRVDLMGQYPKTRVRTLQRAPFRPGNWHSVRIWQEDFLNPDGTRMTPQRVAADISVWGEGG